MSPPKKFLFSFITICIFLSALEIAIRLIRDFEPVRVLCFHPILGNVYCPNTEGYITKGVNRYIKVNSDGLIDKNYPVKRDRGKLRVAVLGDSFTAAEEVNPGKKFHDIWEKRLPGLLGTPVEVINFGARGKGTWQELQMFHLKAKKYKPDLTVLVFFMGNDVEDNLDKLKDKSLNPLLNEYPGSSFWSRLMVRRKNFNKWLWNHSALYQFARRRYNDLEIRLKYYFRPDYMKQPSPSKPIENKNQFKTSQQAKITVAPPPNPQAGPPVNLPAKPPGAVPIHFPRLATKKPPDLQDTTSIYDDKYFFESEGWELTKKLVSRLREEVLENGGEFLLIHFLGKKERQMNLPLPFNEFNRFLESEKITYVDLSGICAEMDYGEFSKNFIQNDIHFNEKGHQSFSAMTLEAVARELKGGRK